MDWLTPARYKLLVGGRWDEETKIWYTADGKEVKPGTEMWTVYFGDLEASFLSKLFTNGETWNDVFGWMTIDFFETWTSWESVKESKNGIPGNMETVFTDGQMNWLTPSRYRLLVGGRWDAEAQIWYTEDGRQILPSTPDWTM